MWHYWFLTHARFMTGVDEPLSQWNNISLCGVAAVLSRGIEFSTSFMPSVARLGTAKGLTRNGYPVGIRKTPPYCWFSPCFRSVFLSSSPIALWSGDWSPSFENCWETTVFSRRIQRYGVIFPIFKKMIVGGIFENFFRWWWWIDCEVWEVFFKNPYLMKIWK